jgi:hypothetical protein
MAGGRVGARAGGGGMGEMVRGWICVCVYVGGRRECTGGTPTLAPIHTERDNQYTHREATKTDIGTHTHTERHAPTCTHMHTHKHTHINKFKNVHQVR